MTSLRCITIATLLLFGISGRIFAESETPGAPRITDVQVGLGGNFKVGHWTPVRLTVSGGGEGIQGTIEFTTPDGDNLATRFVPGSPALVTVPPGQQWTGWRYVKMGQVHGVIRAVFRDPDGKPIAERQVQDLTPHPSTWQWVVTIGTDVGVDEAAVFLARMRDERVVSSVLTDADQFPDRWYGYEGVNVLLVPTGTESLLETLSETQFAALLRWLRLGGRLVVSAGKRAGEIFAAEHRFHVLRPGTFVELTPYWKASGLENFARAAERVAPDDQSRLAVFSRPRGRALCLEGAGGADDRPLVTQYAVGFGDVTYLALDLELSPLLDWPARPRLLARLLQTRSDEEDSAIAEHYMGQVTHVGYDDLAGQLRSALEQFPGVTLVQFSWVAALLVAYILLMGPIEYFGLRRLGHPEWTWVTFPVTVVLFCGAAVYLSQHWKGSRLQLNQVDIVDIDLADQFVRGTTWANIYSPESTRLDIAVTPVPTWPSPAPTSQTGTANTPEVLVSWQGLPGSGLGGMNAATAMDAFSDNYGMQYTVKYPLVAPTDPNASQLDGLPIRTASTKGLLARWSVATALGSADGSAAAAGQLTVDQLDLLDGTVTNPLDVELTHCRVYYRNWAYPLSGPLAAGESVRLDNSQPLDLRWKLTRRSVVGSAEVRSTWQRDDVSDTDRILEVLMFHGAAGGRAYTGLSHNYQSFIDLSRHLYNGQAILVGRSQQPASRLVIRRAASEGDASIVEDDAQQHWTYYRIVIPVRSARESEAN